MHFKSPWSQNTPEDLLQGAVCYQNYKYSSPKAPLAKYLRAVVKKRGQKRKEKSCKQKEWNERSYLQAIHVTSDVNNPEFDVECKKQKKEEKSGDLSFYYFFRCLCPTPQKTAEDGEWILEMRCSENPG